MSKTILYIHSSDELYGADRILLYLVEAVLENQDRPIVVVPRDIKTTLLSDELRKRGVQVYKLDIPVLRRKYFSLIGFFQLFLKFLFSIWGIFTIIQRERVNVIHTNTLAVLSGAIAAKIIRKPHVWHVHEIITHPRFLARSTAFLAGHFSDTIVCVSTPTQANLIHYDRSIANKSIVIHNGIDLQRFDEAKGNGRPLRSAWEATDQDVIAGMVGRISNWKGQDYLLRVASLLIDQPFLRFVMVGGIVPGQEDLMNGLKDLRRELGLENKVIIEDFRQDIPTVIDAFDIFVLPSIQPDPFPTVILEAMAMEKPIVANRHGGSIEMIVDGTSGFLVDPDQPEEMAKRIKELAASKGLRIEMGKCARQNLDLNFTLKQFKEKWIDLYSCLAAEKDS